MSHEHTLEEYLFITNCFECGKDFKCKRDLPSNTIIVCPWCKFEHEYIECNNVEERNKSNEGCSS